jgi:hypothetical protein
MNNKSMKIALNDGTLYTLDGQLVTDLNVFAKLNPSNCYIKDAVQQAPASVATVDEVVTVDAYAEFKNSQSNAWKGAK